MSGPYNLRNTAKKAKEHQIASSLVDRQLIADVLRFTNGVKGGGSPDSPFNMTSGPSDKDIMERHFADYSYVSWSMYQVVHATCIAKKLLIVPGMTGNAGVPSSATDHARRASEIMAMLDALHSQLPVDAFAKARWADEAAYNPADLSHVINIFQACKPILQAHCGSSAVSSSGDLNARFAAVAPPSVMGLASAKKPLVLSKAVTENQELFMATLVSAGSTAGSSTPAPVFPTKTPSKRDLPFAGPCNPALTASAAKPAGGGIGAAIGRTTIGGANGMQTPGKQPQLQSVVDEQQFPALGSAAKPAQGNAGAAATGAGAVVGSYRQSIYAAGGAGRTRAGSNVPSLFRGHSNGGLVAGASQATLIPGSVNEAAPIVAFSQQQQTIISQAQAAGVDVSSALPELLQEGSAPVPVPQSLQKQEPQGFLGKIFSAFSPGGTTTVAMTGGAAASVSSSSSASAISRQPSSKGVGGLVSSLAQSEATILKLQMEELQHEMEVKSNQCRDAMQETAEKQKEIASLTEDLIKSREQASMLQADRDLKEVELARAQRELEESRAKHEEANVASLRALRDAELRAEQEAANRAAIEAQYTTLKAESEATGKEREGRIKRLGETVQDLESKLRASTDKLGEAQASAAAKDVEIASLRGELKQTRDELEGQLRALAALRSQYEHLEGEYRAQKENDGATIAALRSKEQAMVAQAKATEGQLRETLGQIGAFKTELDEARAAILAQQDLSAQHMAAFQAVVTQKSEESSRVVRKARREAELANKRYLQEQGERRRLHDKLQEERGNIRVVARIRPFLPKELAAMGASAPSAPVDLNSSFGSVSSTASGLGGGASSLSGPSEVVKAVSQYELTVAEASSDRQGGRVQESKGYAFDYVFDPKCPNQAVFDEGQGLVTSAMDGKNSCIFAYGQTGSGKTYTMVGDGKENPGVYGRAFGALFEHAHVKRNEWAYEIRVQMIEIYNETIRDLLAGTGLGTTATAAAAASAGAGAGAATAAGASSSAAGGAGGADDDAPGSLKIKTGPNGNYLPDAVSVTVTCPEDVERLMELGNKNRSVGRTNANEHSSRSHSLLMIEIIGRSLISEDLKTHGRLVLIDLAGSERVSKSGAEGQRMKEAQNINGSLLALGDVIAALANKQGHIPYRNSKLTHLLQDCLSKDNKILMIVQVSPALESRQETICSLNFASRAKKVELGKVTKHTSGMDAAEASRFKSEIKRLTEGKTAAEEAAVNFKRELAHATEALEGERRSKAAAEKELAARLQEAEAQIAQEKAAARALAEEVEKAKKEAKAAEAQAKKALAAAGAQSSSLARNESEVEAKIEAAVKKALDASRAQHKRDLLDQQQALKAEADKALNALKKQQKEAVQQLEARAQRELESAVSAAIEKAEREATKKAMAAAAAAAPPAAGATGANRRVSVAGPYGGTTAAGPRDRLSILMPAAVMASAPAPPPSVAGSSASASLNSSLVSEVAIAAEPVVAAAAAAAPGTPTTSVPNTAAYANAVSAIKEADEEVDADEGEGEEGMDNSRMTITPGASMSAKKAFNKGRLGGRAQLKPADDEGEDAMASSHLFFSPVAGADGEGTYPAFSGTVNAADVLAGLAGGMPGTPGAAIASAAIEQEGAEVAAATRAGLERRPSLLEGRKATPFVAKKSKSHLEGEDNEEEADDDDEEEDAVTLDSSLSATETSVILPADEDDEEAAEPAKEHTGFAAFGAEDKEYVRGRDEAELRANAANVARVANRMVRHHRNMATPADEKPKGLLKGGKQPAEAAATAAGSKKGVMLQTPAKGTIRQPGQMGTASAAKPSVSKARTAASPSAAAASSRGSSADSRPASRAGSVTFSAGSTPAKAAPLSRKGSAGSVSFAAGATPVAKEAALAKRKATPKPAARPADDNEEEDNETEAEDMESTNTSLASIDADVANASFRSVSADDVEGAAAPAGSDPLSIAQSLASAFADTAPPKEEVKVVATTASARATTKPAVPTTSTIRAVIRKPAVPTAASAAAEASAGAGSAAVARKPAVPTAASAATASSSIRAKVVLKVASSSSLPSTAASSAAASRNMSRASSVASLKEEDTNGAAAATGASASASEGASLASSLASSRASSVTRPAVAVAAPVITAATTTGLVARRPGATNSVAMATTASAAARVVATAKPRIPSFAPVKAVIIENGGAEGENAGSAVAASAAAAPVKKAGGAMRVAVAATASAATRK